MIRGPPNPPKTINFDCIISNPQVILMWGRTVSQFLPDSPRKAPTRKANFVEVLERWGSVPYGNCHFTFVCCWLFSSLLNLSLQTERCKFLEAKVATNKETVQDLRHCVMPQVLLQHIYIYNYDSIPSTFLILNLNKLHPPFPGWCEFMNQNNQEK